MGPRTRDEVKQALDVQRQAISASSKSYDDGNRWEALRLASAVYNIVHDHGKIRSLLTQLGIRGSLKFVASNRARNSNNLMRETLLVAARVYGDGSAEYLPHLDGSHYPPRLVQLYEWWEKDIILADGKFELTRKRLVFVLRNQEGGGHFSTEMNDHAYLRFSREQLNTPYVLAPGKAPKPLLGAELASMRQVAWELMKTLNDHGPLK
jgi:hypothetical protein